MKTFAPIYLTHQEKMEMAQICELCKHSVPLSHCHTFELRNGRLKSLDTEGRSPWAGVRFVCNDCLRTIAVSMAVSVVVSKFEENDAKETEGNPRV